MRLSDRAVIKVPSNSMDPAVGQSSPAIKPNKVDFPLPEGPTTATFCFAGISSVTSSRIVTGRPPALRRIERCLIEIICHPLHNARVIITDGIILESDGSPRKYQSVVRHPAFRRRAAHHRSG